MEFRYIITIGADEVPLCVSKELEPNITAVLIAARTWEEAVRTFRGVNAV